VKSSLAEACLGPVGPKGQDDRPRKVAAECARITARIEQRLEPFLLFPSAEGIVFGARGTQYSPGRHATTRTRASSDGERSGLGRGACGTVACFLNFVDPSCTRRRRHQPPEALQRCTRDVCCSCEMRFHGPYAGGWAKRVLGSVVVEALFPSCAILGGLR
jgi:hypothetical protein